MDQLAHTRAHAPWREVLLALQTGANLMEGALMSTASLLSRRRGVPRVCLHRTDGRLYSPSRSHGDRWERGEAGDYAASARSATCMSGYQRLNTEPDARLSVLTRVCSSKCAPR